MLHSGLSQTLDEDFDDGSADNWAKVSGSGTWTVPSGPTDRIYTHASVLGGENISVYNGASWNKNYTYTGRVRLWGSGSGNLVGLVYQYQSTTSYYAVLLSRSPGSGTGTSQLVQKSGSTAWSVLSTATYTLPSTGSPDNNYVTVSIERSNSDVTTVKINGVATHSLSQPFGSAGKVGVVNQWAASEFNNLTVGIPEVHVTGLSGLAVADGSAVDPNNGTNFGSVDVSGGTVTRTFTVHNQITPAGTGGSALSLGTVSTTGDFTVIAQPAATVAPGGTTTFQVRFDPTATGVRNGTVSVSTNDTGENPYNFSVQGTGTSGSTSGEIEVRGNMDAEELSSAIIASGDNTPTIVDHTDFGSEFVTAATTVRTFTIYNKAATTLTVGTVTLTGSSDFTIIAQPATSVAPGTGAINADGRTRFSILFNPSSSGVKTATVSIPNSDGNENPYTFAIRGNGVTGTFALKAAYPRLGGIFYANNSNPPPAGYGFHYTDTVYQQNIAKYDLGILSMWKNWYGGTAIMNQVVNDIKALNPDILLGNYTILESTADKPNDQGNKLDSEVGPTGNGGTWTPNDWWAHHSNGTTDFNDGYPSMLLTNITHFVTPDSNGDRYPQWYGKWAATNLLNPITQLDFVYCDNGFYKPRRDMDWDRNGVDDSQDSATVQAYYRAGHAAHWAQLKTSTSTSGLMVMANLGGQPSYRRGNGRDLEFQRKIEMALGESMAGATGTTETYSGWYNMMVSYWSRMDNTLAPHIVMFGSRCTEDGKSFVNPGNYGGGNAYAFARYMIASGLMDNGFIELHSTNYAAKQPPWFDEFDLAGTSNTSWLGTPYDPPQRAPKQNGVFIRRFQNGMAIVNPRTEPYLVNGQLILRTAQPVNIVTLFPGATYQRFQGNQAPSVNNGATITGAITIQPGDGLILKKL